MSLSWLTKNQRIIKYLNMSLIMVIILSCLNAYFVADAAFIPWKAVEAGLNHSMAINSKGELWAWGDNSYHQLGNGDNIAHNEPIKIMDNVMAIAAGSFHSLALTTTGVVYAWGWNSRGQLGDGTYINSMQPKEIMTGVRSIAAGHEFSLAISNRGELYSWGDNTYGQLGQASGVRSVSSPQSIITNVAKVSAGTFHLLILDNQGKLLTCGRNDIGQTGHGAGTDIRKPQELMQNVQDISAGGWHSLAIQNSKLYVWGNNTYGQLATGNRQNLDVPTVIIKFEHVQGVAAGDNTSIIITDEGYLYCLGGDVPLSITSSEVHPMLGEVVQATAGGNHVLALQKNGALFSWGSNENGQLGYGQKETRGTPLRILYNIKEISAGSNHALALGKDGSLYAWGNSTWGQTAQNSIRNQANPQLVIDKVVIAVAGSDHNLLFNQTGQIMVWGANSFGQLGNGSNVERRALTPIAMPGVVTISEAVYNDSSTISASAYGTRAKEPQVIQFAAGMNHSLMLKDNGEVWVWGDNSFGQLGLSSGEVIINQPIKLMENVRSIACGDNFSMVIMQDRSLWVWGDNSSGQLGLGDKVQRNVPTKLMEGVQAADGGKLHMLIIGDDNTLYACGSNQMSQLGLGSSAAKESLYPVRTMSSIRAIAAAGETSLAIGVDGQSWGWGNNASHQINATAQNIFYTPQRILEGVQSVSAGLQASYLLLQDGTLWTLGSKSYGQLGDGSMYSASYEPKRVKLAPEGTSSELVLQVDRSIMWALGQIVEVDPGRETSPQLINNQTMLPIRSVIERFGGTVNYNEVNQSTILSLNGHTLEITVNSSNALHNGTSVQITAPQVRNERTLVHIRVLEYLGLNLKWDPNDESITLRR